MVRISSNRMRSVTDARNALSAIVGDAERGIVTHILKGSTVVAHVLPADAPVLDDLNLRTALVAALSYREAVEIAQTEWRDDRLWSVGDTIGRLLCWTWQTSPDFFIRTLAVFHHDLQQAVKAAIDIGVMWSCVETALRVGLDGVEIAEVAQYVRSNYHEYDLGPFLPPGQTLTTQNVTVTNAEVVQRADGIGTLYRVTSDNSRCPFSLILGHSH
jgi:hypothetical protein